MIICKTPREVEIMRDYYGDSAWTYAEESHRRLDVTEESLFQGLKKAKPGERLSNISHAIQECVEENGFSVVREYAGHGVRKDLHEDPDIPYYSPQNKGPLLKPGMVLGQINVDGLNNLQLLPEGRMLDNVL
jgi:methionyl aminopeptidase